MLNTLQTMLQTQTNRFFYRRIRDMEVELEHVDEQLEELNIRRSQILDNIAFAESRIAK